MSRSRRKTPIAGVTTAESEADDKARWHRRHRRAEDVSLRAHGLDFMPRHRNTHSSTWNMDKDGKHYFDAAKHPKGMRK